MMAFSPGALFLVALAGRPMAAKTINCATGSCDAANYGKPPAMHDDSSFFIQKSVAHSRLSRKHGVGIDNMLHMLKFKHEHALTDDDTTKVTNFLAKYKFSDNDLFDIATFVDEHDLDNAASSDVAQFKATYGLSDQDISEIASFVTDHRLEQMSSNNSNSNNSGNNSNNSNNSNSSNNQDYGRTSVGPCRAEGLADIAACNEQSVFLKEDGTAWAAGNNNRWQFGSGAGEDGAGKSIVPVQTKISDVIKIFAGLYNTYFLKSDYTLWGSGSNYRGQLTHEQNIEKYDEPVQIASDVVFAAAGANFVLMIMTDGTVWGRGHNSDGQLGTGSINDDGVFQMTQMLHMYNAKKVVVGRQYGDYSHVLQQDGTVWATGENRFGQLGTGDTIDVHTPVQVMSDVKDIFSGSDYTTFVVKADNSVWGWGRNTDGQVGSGSDEGRHFTPVQITPFGGVIFITGGAEHTIFLMDDGSAFLAGIGKDGALGNGREEKSRVPLKVSISNVVKVAAGDDFSLFLDSNCNVWGTGDNSDGAIMDPDTWGSTRQFRTTPKIVWSLL